MRDVMSFLRLVVGLVVVLALPAALSAVPQGTEGTCVAEEGWYCLTSAHTGHEDSYCEGSAEDCHSCCLSEDDVCSKWNTSSPGGYRDVECPAR